MKRRFVLAALPATLVALTSATKTKKALPLPPLGDTVLVEMITAQGTILLELDHKHAPITTENFMRYVDSGRYNGMMFYRAMHLNWGTEPNGLLQGGLNQLPARLMKPIPHEPTNVTGLTHKAGTLSMARNAPGTAMDDFSILLSDLTSFDANPASRDPETRAGYAVFGRVVSGMDLVRRLYDAPRSPTKGEGFMKGQMLDPPVKVLKVRRMAAPQSSPTGGGGSAPR